MYDLFRINWNNGDWVWLKSQCPNNIKYWKKDAQWLQKVNEVDRRITQFPQIFFDEIGTLDEIIENVVVFSAKGIDGPDWNVNIDIGRRLMEELPERSKNAQDGSHDWKFVIKRVEGYKKDKALKM